MGNPYITKTDFVLNLIETQPTITGREICKHLNFKRPLSYNGFLINTLTNPLPNVVLSYIKSVLSSINNNVKHDITKFESFRYVKSILTDLDLTFTIGHMYNQINNHCRYITDGNWSKSKNWRLPYQTLSDYSKQNVETLNICLEPHIIHMIWCDTLNPKQFMYIYNKYVQYTNMLDYSLHQRNLVIALITANKVKNVKLSEAMQYIEMVHIATRIVPSPRVIKLFSRISYDSVLILIQDLYDNKTKGYGDYIYMKDVNLELLRLPKWKKLSLLDPVRKIDKSTLLSKVDMSVLRLVRGILPVDVKQLNKLFNKLQTIATNKSIDSDGYMCCLSYVFMLSTIYGKDTVGFNKLMKDTRLVDYCDILTIKSILRDNVFWDDMSLVKIAKSKISKDIRWLDYLIYFSRIGTSVKTLKVLDVVEYVLVNNDIRYVSKSEINTIITYQVTNITSVLDYIKYYNDKGNLRYVESNYIKPVFETIDGKYTLRWLSSMAENSMIGNTKGNLSCQSIDSEAESVCVHSITSKFSDTFVILNELGVPVVHSWVWCDAATTGVVFDTIEAPMFKDTYFGMIEDLMLMFNSIGYDVYISDTTYGITDNVLHKLKYSETAEKHICLPEYDDCEYVDGIYHHRVWLNN